MSRFESILLRRLQVSTETQELAVADSTDELMDPGVCASIIEDTESDSDAMDSLLATANGMESLYAIGMESNRPLSQRESQLFNSAMSSALAISGVSLSEVPSLEAAADATVSLESIGSKLKEIWKKIYATIRAIIAKIRDFFVKIFNGLRGKSDSTKKKVAAFKEKAKNNPGMNRPGKGSASTEGISLEDSGGFKPYKLLLPAHLAMEIAKLVGEKPKDNTTLTHMANECLKASDDTLKNYQSDPLNHVRGLLESLSAAIQSASKAGKGAVVTVAEAEQYFHEYFSKLQMAFGNLIHGSKTHDNVYRELLLKYRTPDTEAHKGATAVELSSDGLSLEKDHILGMVDKAMAVCVKVRTYQEAIDKTVEKVLDECNWFTLEDEGHGEDHMVHTYHVVQLAVRQTSYTKDLIMIGHILTRKVDQLFNMLTELAVLEPTEA